MPSHIFLANDAVSDILIDQRYEGAIDSIGWLTDIVDGGFMMYISFIAFFIISVALLRNVLAACYIAFPRFWDKVAQAHEKKRETAYFERVTGFFKGGWKQTSNSTIADFILGILPNVKCWTDFADGNGDELAVKDYVIKAIPQMILVVGIGVFIYNGYYRDTAAKITQAGSEVFERFVTSVDPVETVDRLLATTGTPDFSTDDALTKYDEFHNTICHQVYAAMVSKYTDINDATAKTNLAESIESMVNGWLAEDKDLAELAADQNYRVTIKTGITKSGFSKSGQQESEDPNIKAFKLPSKSVFDLNFESTKNVGEDFYINVSVMFTKDIQEEKSRTLEDVTLELCVQGTSGTVNTWTIQNNTGNIDFSNWKGGEIGGVEIIEVKNNVITFGGTPPELTDGPFKVQGTKFRLRVGDYTVKPNEIKVSSGMDAPTFICKKYKDSKGNTLKFTNEVPEDIMRASD